MKVYELMNTLKNMPAGATVQMKTVRTSTQLYENTVENEFVEGKGFVVEAEIVEAEEDGHGAVILHGD